MTLLREKAKLDLGDEVYAEAEAAAVVFVKWIVNKGWFDKNRLLSGEGSAANMVETTLTYIVYHGDINVGKREYLKVLASEYDIRLKHNQFESLDTLVDTADEITPKGNLVEQAGGFVASLRGDSPPVTIQVIEDDGPRLVCTRSEMDLMLAIADTGSNVAAFGLLGLTPGQGRAAVRRVRTRAARLV